MRVLFLNPGAQLGGAERSLLDMIESLLATANPPTLALICLEDGPLVDEARRAGVAAEVVELPKAWRGLGDADLTGRYWVHFLRLAVSTVRGGLRGIPAIWTLRRRIHNFRPDLVHSNGFKTHVLSAFATPLKVPIIWHLRDMLSRRRVMRALLFILQPRVSLVLANSDFVRSDAQRFLRLPIQTLLNAIDVDWFSQGSGLPVDLDGIANLPRLNDVLRVGLVATFASWKGQTVFMEAAAIAKESVPARLRFYIIGSPIYSTSSCQLSTDQLRRGLEDLGLQADVGLIPFQRDPRAIYRALDIVVHASTAPEPFGRTVVEAMASERAVIAVNAGAIPEIVQDGVEGLLVPPADPAALAAAIARLADDSSLRRSLAHRARKTAHHRFARSRLGPALRLAYARFALSSGR